MGKTEKVLVTGQGKSRHIRDMTILADGTIHHNPSGVSSMMGVPKVEPIEILTDTSFHDKNVNTRNKTGITDEDVKAVRQLEIDRLKNRLGVLDHKRKKKRYK